MLETKIVEHQVEDGKFIATLVYNHGKIVQASEIFVRNPPNWDKKEITDQTKNDQEKTA